jgi:hypothetical protein
MAGDWIKIETITPDKPEVIRMAYILGIDQDAVVGKLVRVWVWADQNSLNGNGLSVTLAFLNRLTVQQGFAEALLQVGWLLGDDGNLTFPDFTKHNGQSAKTRADTNRRVAKHREKRNGNGESVTDVTPEPSPKPLPEKRREERVQQQQQHAGATPEPAAAEAGSITRLHPHCTQLEAEQWAVHHNANALDGVMITPEIVVGWWEDRTRTEWQTVKQGTRIPLSSPKAVETDLVAYARAWARNANTPKPDFGRKPPKEIVLTSKPNNGW